ncbi:MAG TPA: hypothetical protein VFW29_08260, partial [Solirubrobacteraceae bacterium]|nr:hypothetical protein [Solirubrobacteraceae bacterium]
AALARAERHRGGQAAAVPLWAILDQLALPRRSHAAREAARLLVQLEAGGAIRSERRHGATLWKIAPPGSALLRRAPADALELPESPQHRAWRDARTLARGEIERFRAAMRDSLREAEALLRAPRPQHRSEDWFALAERLRRRAWTLGSATHCLYEWAEPDDAAADLDPHGSGRRNVTLWRV